MRLDKFLCSSTDLTRTQAKRAIGKSRVTVNGQITTNSACKINDEDQITLDEQPLTLVGNRYIMLNKPPDFICSTVDESHPSVFNLLIIEKPQLLHTAGRLDADTTGLVLITDDGQWSHQITSPNRQCAKTYHVKLADPITSDNQSLIIEQFKQGIMLKSENAPTKPAELTFITPTQVILKITEGKYHQVKRMFAAIGNKVAALHRQAVGEIELDDELQLGEWRYLTEQEVASVG